MEYWKPDELPRIGDRGFPALNMGVKEPTIGRLCDEACGSPQLMQSLCLQTCYRLDVFDKLTQPKEFNVTNEDVAKVLESTSTMADFSTLVEKMHEGPKLRGQERKEYSFTDGTRGDVYRSVLLALSADPPSMTLPYAELMSRVQMVCVDESPVGSSVSEACIQIDKVAERLSQPESAVGSLKPVEWDTSSSVETIHMAEPYFLFYLRSSQRLVSLGRRAPADPGRASTG
jgi:hypothetical protein